MSFENDIFNNPLEAFPEFIDEPASSPSADSIPVESVSEPAVHSSVTTEKKTSDSRIAVLSSDKYIDPLDTVEEVDISTLSLTDAITFNDDKPLEAVEDSSLSFFEKTNFTLGSFDYEDVAVKPGAELYDIDDTVPDAISETEEVSIDDFLSGAGNGTEEIDLDAFLGDSGFSSPASSPVSASDSVTEEISLDDFGVDFGGFDASAIDAFASSAKQEKSDIENAPAIDMELEFDDDFVLETKANPEDDIDFDFEALMSGQSIDIPQPSVSSGDDLLDNFDNIFDNIVDESVPSTGSGSSSVEFDPSAIEEVSLDDFGLGDGSSSIKVPSSDGLDSVSEQQIVFDEVSEFDDLLSSFSNETHVEVADNRKSSNENAGPHDYNIIVVLEEDDGQIANQAPVSENTSDDEDYEISLFASNEEASAYRNHSTGFIPSGWNDASETDSLGESVSASSDSFEDISLDDFGVSFEDETPSTESSSALPAKGAEDSEPADIPQEPEDSEPADIPQEPEYEEESADTVCMDEASDFVTECEDTTIDDKKIVELSEDCVYNGDNSEYTPDMIDGYNEEISDTMDSMNEGLLEKIVSELSVLRNEMQTLRDEMQTLKGGESSVFETEAAPAVQEEDIAIPEVSETIPESPVEEEIPLPEVDPLSAPQEAGGFFSGDDDDETIALSGDELNNILNSADFTQEDASSFAVDDPEGSALSDGLDDFAMEPPAEETVTETEDISADDFSIDEPSIEEPAFEETTIEESVSEETEEAAADESEEISIDDFNTDLPSLKDEQEPAAEEEKVTSDEEFSLDEFDIPEPAVEENPIADFDIDEPEEPKTEEFSLDEFDIPEPSADESSISDIEIDEPSAEIPVDEPASEDFAIEETPVIEETPAETNSEDADFYANSDSPAITEDDISALDIQENLEEPVLDDIDFGVDEPQSEDIEIPTGESLVVDSSSTDFLEEEDPTLDEQLTSEKVEYLNEEASVDDLGELPEIEEESSVEGMEDSLESDTLATSEDETPADDVFSSQWDSIPETVETETSSDDFFEEEEETVQASKSFDDPLSFDIEEPAESIPSDESELSADIPAEDDFSLDEPSIDIPADEPVEAPAAAAEPALDNDIKQEVKSVLKYMDQLLENLPEDKIAEFAQSEHFETYKKLFNELGLV